MKEWGACNENIKRVSIQRKTTSPGGGENGDLFTLFRKEQLANLYTRQLFFFPFEA